MMFNISRFLVALVLLVTASAKAHEVRPALLTVVQTSETNYEVTFKQPQVQGRFLNLGIESNCQLELNDARTSSAALQEKFSMSCGEPLEFLEISGLEKTLIDTMITIDDIDGVTSSYLVNGRNPRVDTSQGASTPVYFILGMEHLAFGIDHVLFVLLLLYLVKGFMNLVKVITSFTVAHSITLALSAFDIVSVSQPPVEALIALSIVLLAAEALRDEESLIHKWPWLITFVFGLLHGLGFAGALSEIGLPRDTAVLALFLFNIGIEIAQIAIIAVALALIYAVTRFSTEVPRLMVILPVYVTGGLASYWFIERTFIVFGLIT